MGLQRCLKAGDRFANTSRPVRRMMEELPAPCSLQAHSEEYRQNPTDKTLSLQHHWPYYPSRSCPKQNKGVRNHRGFLLGICKGSKGIHNHFNPLPVGYHFKQEPAIQYDLKIISISLVFVNSTDLCWQCTAAEAAEVPYFGECSFLHAPGTHFSPNTCCVRCFLPGLVY